MNLREEMKELNFVMYIILEIGISEKVLPFVANNLIPHHNLQGRKRLGVYYQGSRQKMKLLDFLALKIYSFSMRESLDRNPK